MTEQTDLVSPAIVAALASLDDLARDKTATVATKAGGSYSYSYTDLASVLGHVRPVLAKHDLVILQPVSTTDGQVAVETVILHASGQERRFPALLLPRGNTPQETGSAITYARRYSLLSALGLATEDDDGKAASTPARKPRGRTPKPDTAEASPVTVPAAANQGKAQLVELFGGDKGLAAEAWRIARDSLGIDVPDSELTASQVGALVRAATPPEDTS